MGDRREYPRLEIAVDATFRIEGSGAVHRATLANVSASGAAFVVEEPLAAGARLDPLRFTIGPADAAETFSLEVETIRCTERQGVGRANEYLVATRFVTIEPDAQSRLHDFVLAELGSGQCAPRIDIEKPVAVRFDRFDEFVTEVSKNLSLTGMFIGTERPHPIGTTFEFVLQLGEDLRMVQGRAEVVWAREEQDGPEQLPGMGIRFLEMDSTSESVLRRLIEHHTGSPHPQATPTQADTESGELLDPLSDLDA